MGRGSASCRVYIGSKWDEADEGGPDSPIAGCGTKKCPDREGGLRIRKVIRVAGCEEWMSDELTSCGLQVARHSAW